MTEIYSLLPPICEKLRIGVPELYDIRDQEMNAGTTGTVNPCIYVTSNLVQQLSLKQIAGVLVHECGHIACKPSCRWKRGRNSRRRHGIGQSCRRSCTACHGAGICRITCIPHKNTDRIPSSFFPARFFLTPAPGAACKAAACSDPPWRPAGRQRRIFPAPQGEAKRTDSGCTTSDPRGGHTRDCGEWRFD